MLKGFGTLIVEYGSELVLGFDGGIWSEGAMDPIAKEQGEWSRWLITRMLLGYNDSATALSKLSIESCRGGNKLVVVAER